MRVVRGRDAVFGLVQQHIYFVFEPYLFVAEGYRIGGCDFRAELGHYVAVYFYLAGLYELVGLAARADTGIGQELVEAYRLCGVYGRQLILYALGARYEAFLPHSSTVVFASEAAAVVAEAASLVVAVVVSAAVVIVTALVVVTVVIPAAVVVVAALVVVVAVVVVTSFAVAVGGIVVALGIFVIVISAVVVIPALVVVAVVRKIFVILLKKIFCFLLH